MPAAGKLAATIRITVAVVLGGIGAAAGFTHTHDWAVHHGQVGWLAWADAVVIEGIVTVAGFELHRDHQRGKTTRRVTFPLFVLVAGFGVQMTAQVADAERSPAGWLLAAMPALGFLTVVKLLMRRIPTQPATQRDAMQQPETPEPVAPQPIPVPADEPTPDSEPTPVPPAPSPEPTAIAAELPAAAPEPPVRRPVRASRMKLPAPMREQITAAADAARHEGRALTTADIRAVVKVPEQFAEQIVADLAPA